jgi:pyrroloquinoline quinone (PQQ) biosynthesis protein C
LVAIERAWPELAPRDRVFFDLHAAVDDSHAEVLGRIAIALSDTLEGRREIIIGVLKALNARSVFFDDMLAYLQRTDSSNRTAEAA